MITHTFGLNTRPEHLGAAGVDGSCTGDAEAVVGCKRALCVGTQGVDTACDILGIA